MYTNPSGKHPPFGRPRAALIDGQRPRPGRQPIAAQTLEIAKGETPDGVARHCKVDAGTAWSPAENRTPAAKRDKAERLRKGREAVPELLDELKSSTGNCSRASRQSSSTSSRTSA